LGWGGGNGRGEGWDNDVMSEDGGKGGENSYSTTQT